MRVVTADSVIELGTVETAPTIGITDYSKRVTDDFGVTTVVPRGFARRMSVMLGVPFDQVDALQAQLADLRATEATWIADDRLTSLSVRGFYKDFEVTLDSALSLIPLTIEGTAEADTFVDPGGDPAGEGRSTLQLLDPLAIEGGVLVSSSVAEDDAPTWAAGTTYAKAAKVVVAHRVYESLIDANLGNDPAGAGGQWLDVGPTRRVAMFDQALGTATIAAAPIEVVLAPGIAVSALAVLDTNAATVRVQAPGYDRTQAPNAAGKALFLDLAVAADARVTVTITSAGAAAPRRWDDGAAWMDDGVWRDSLAAGDGTVTVGTLLIGQLRGLGVTEASPTAGITDYSRKVTDDFGEVTVVPRAWAKKMGARALIRTDAVDLVAGRLAAVRARPSLWVGQDGVDSLTIYGFYKDWEITVGESVSKLSLSIEGLSQAAKVQPFAPGGSVAWPDIIGPNKPADNADVTGDNTSKDTATVSGRPSGDVVAAIDAAKARQAVLDNEIIPAIDAAITGADTRITAARGAADTAKARADSALTRIDSEVTRLDTRIDSVSASGGYDDTTLKAEVRRVEQAALGRDAALGQRVDSVTASINDTGTHFGAEIQRVETAAVDRDNAIGRRIDTIIAEGGGGSEGVDSVARAEVSRVEQASVERDGALGSRVDTVSASIGPAINAKAQEITTAYAAADTLIANRATLLEASSRADTAMMNGNASFSDWPDSRGSVPNGWGLILSSSGVVATATRVPGVVGRYALQTGWNGSSSPANFFYAVSGLNFGDPYGGIDPGMFGGPGWYVMEADITLVSGSLVRSGMYCASYNSNGVNITTGSAHFPDHPANGGAAPGAGLPGARYKFAVLLDFTDPNTRSFRFHPMVVWEAFGGSSPVKTITWNKTGVRAATPEEIAARRADTNANSALARVAVVETAVTDGRFAASSRAAMLEAQVNGARDSELSNRIAGVDGRVTGVNNALIARIEDRATAIADAKSGAVAQTVQTLRSEYNGTAASVTQQAGTIVDLQRRSASYIRFIADAGGGRASFDLFADGYGGRWALTGDGLITGNVAVDGNVVISGSLSARKFNSASMSRFGTAVWNGSLTPSAGSRVLVPWSLRLAAIPPQGRFIYEFTATVATNAGQQNVSTYNGRPLYTNFLPAGGGLEVICLDPQGNGYRPRPNSSDPVLATAEFEPLFQASIGNGNYDSGIINDGDYYYRNVAATYTLTSIDLRLTWVAI